MCVDDYQFRHYSARRQKLCRRFIFRNQQEHQRVFLVNISQFERYGQLCLCQVLMHLNKKGLNIKDYSFYMPQFDITIEAGDKCKIPFDIMTFKEVVFEMKLLEKNRNENYSNLYFSIENYLKKVDFQIGEADQLCCQECSNWKGQASIGEAFAMQTEKINGTDISKQKETNKEIRSQTTQDHENEEHEAQGQSGNNKNQVRQYTSKSYGIKIKSISNGAEVKKQKQHEKTIQEALFKTKMWRMLHENCNFSLKIAAQMVQLSKKTLDDYFLVLRVAQYHGYDFKSNLNKKIGHMRAFIRRQPVKVTGRLPKQVKSFSLVPDPDLSKIVPISDWSKVKQIEQEDPSGSMGSMYLDQTPPDNNENPNPSQYQMVSQ